MEVVYFRNTLVARSLKPFPEKNTVIHVKQLSRLSLAAALTVSCWYIGELIMYNFIAFERFSQRFKWATISCKGDLYWLPDKLKKHVKVTCNQRQSFSVWSTLSIAIIFVPTIGNTHKDFTLTRLSSQDTFIAKFPFRVNEKESILVHLFTKKQEDKKDLYER